MSSLLNTETDFKLILEPIIGSEQPTIKSITQMPTMPTMPTMPMMPMTMPMMAPMQQMPQMPQMTPDMMMQYMMMMRSMYPMPMGFMMPPSMMMPMSSNTKPISEMQPILTPKSLETVAAPAEPAAVQVAAAVPAPKPEPVTVQATPVATEPVPNKEKPISALPTFIPPSAKKPAQKAKKQEEFAQRSPSVERSGENIWMTRKQRQPPKKDELVADDTPTNPDEIILINHTQFPKHYPAWIDPRSLNEFKWLQATIKKYKIPFKLKEKKGELRNCSLSSESYPDFMFCVNYYDKDTQHIDNIIFYDTTIKYGAEGKGLIVRMIEFYEGGGVRRYSIYDPETKHYHVCLYDRTGDIYMHIEKTKLNSMKAEDVINKTDMRSETIKI